MPPPKSKTSIPTNPSCPFCKKDTMVVKIGMGKSKHDVFQRYKCKSCNKTFSDRPLKNITYPPKIIFTAISLYNLGNTKKQITSILTKRFNIEVPIPTIHSWLKRYQNVCTFINLRRKFVLDPKSLIRSRKLHHVQVYNFKYHQLKLNLAAKKFPQLRYYIVNIFDNCPNELFRAQGPRCSSLRIPIKPRRATKQNNAPKLAEFALFLTRATKDRHKEVQDFMLINDSATVIAELPAFIHPDEISRAEKKTYGIEISDTLTGHIDILQVRFDRIHVLDYREV